MQPPAQVDTRSVSFPTQRLKILLAARDDDRSGLIRSRLVASTRRSLHVDQASTASDWQRQALDGTYDAVLVDTHLDDVDGETCLWRLRSMGVVAPVLMLTSNGGDHPPPHGADDYLAITEVLNGDTLVRAIVAVVEHHHLTLALAAARNQAALATTTLSELAHDLATPLGVVMGMTQALLTDDNGLNLDSRACLEDVAREALRACAILKRLNPIDASASPPRQPATLDPDLRRATASGPGSRTVVIADDDPATRRLVCATLKSDQYTVLEAADGEHAWRLIRDHHPAVAILDWQMPIYSGLELTDVIKGDPQVQGMTVIMLTGRTAQADREAGARARADLYLVKPFLPLELLGAVQQALGIS